MSESVDYRTRLVGDLNEIGRESWDRLVRDSCGGHRPAFLRFDFLESLARQGCVGGASGWKPSFLILESRRDGTLAGAVPLYRKNHSYGEYVFDWAWADAYRRHGLHYYPKLLAAIPFTPVTGARLIAPAADTRVLLAQALVALARDSGLSSLHVLFPRDEEAQPLREAGLMERRGVQFHWTNGGAWTDFDGFLQSLSQPKRKKIRAERRKVREAGIHCTRRDGTQLDERDWHFFHRCYASTYAAHGSTPYLNEAFFQEVGARMPEAFVMVQAWRGPEPVAASLLVRDHDRLYGRYWGCLERVDALHFECAYYQAIEAALERGLAVVEGGAQGEHKMARGFLPQETRSMHWLAEPAFADAVRDFLNREGRMMSGYLDELDERTPFRAPDQ